MARGEEQPESRLQVSYRHRERGRHSLADDLRALGDLR